MRAFITIGCYLVCGLHATLAVVSWYQGDFKQDLIYSSDEAAEGRIPELPEKYQADWHLYVHPLDDEPSPWYKLPPVPYEVGRGSTYYDYTRPAMVQRYYDFCLPIFGGLDYHWPCDLHHLGNVSYVISEAENAPYGPCCIWREPWHIPAPDFAKAMKYDRTDMYHGVLTKWYTLGSRDGKYSYGFTWSGPTPNDEKRYSLFKPGAFAYPLDKGWGAQDFYNVKRRIRHKSVFEVPESCRKASYCVGPPV